jgi:hypothetical protein
MAKIIWSGLEDSGKTYMLAKASIKILKRNIVWAKKTGKPRPIVSNLPYSNLFKSMCYDAQIPLYNWKDLDEFVNWQNTGKELRNADVFVDEIGTYFDSRTFKDLPLDVRLYLAQASKMGVDMYGAAQDFAQVDIAFRRLTTQLFYVRKLAGSPRPAETKPKVKLIWGFCTIKEMDPMGYDEKMLQFNSKSIFPWPFFLRKDYCEIFDTTCRIPRSAPPSFKHVPRHCEDPKCKFEMYEFSNGVKYKVSHI